MLVEKTDSRIAETAIPVGSVVPLAPVVRLRASSAGFRPVCLSDLETLTHFYAQLDEPLADLNALMMIAWRRVLDLHLLIEDEVLYMVANWEGGPMLWGPPIGDRVSMNHIRKAFQLLRQLDPDDSEPVIAYLWEGYSLWETLVESDEFVAVREGTEYIYDTSKIAALAGGEYKKKRKEYLRFKETHDPEVHEYSDALVADCLRLLERWMSQKSRTVSGDDWEKLLAECTACEVAFRDRMPFRGVVALVDGKVCAFSLGGPQGKDRFSCMFEKTDLDFPPAPAFIFSQLAQKLVGSHSEITLGEDWHVGYLTHSKQLWHPKRQQASYYLQERLNEVSPLHGMTLSTLG